MTKCFAAFSMLALLATACVSTEEDSAEVALEASQSELAAPITVAGVCEDQLAFCEGRCVMGPPAFRQVCFQRCYVNYQDCIGR
jgi:hypothetical protein